LHALGHNEGSASTADSQHGVDVAAGRYKSGKRLPHCGDGLTSISAAQKRHAPRMVGSDLGPRNIDVAAGWADANIDDNRHAACFRDHAAQISKLLAFCVSRADDEDAPHRRISGPAAASVIEARSISEAHGCALIFHPSGPAPFLPAETAAITC